ncbi:MAG TPA: ATP-binding cassette domain-containing protein, partial [Pirellulales bacterium]|nr:ATP-binding cassette domain-containing protein [Pirellulales bacterium]
MRFSRGAISRGQKLDAVSINTTTLILIGLTMALLEIQDLTMQFGGLTAVNAVTARVEPGQIFSIIGPNGAGKTTVFNAVTGIYDPTAGQILFHDRELRRPFTWKTVLLCALSGILTAIAVTLLTANVDRLWLATIKNPYNNQPDTFSLKTVWHDLLGYFHGEPVVERNSGFAARRQPWRIATADRRQTLNEVLGRRPQDLPPPKKGEPQERFARAYFADLQAVLSLPEADRQPRREGDDWLIRSPGSDKILAQYDSEDDAQTKTEIINQILHAQVATPLMAILSLLGGLVLGAAGAFVVWQRSRRTPDVISLGGIAR